MVEHPTGERKKRNIDEIRTERDLKLLTSDVLSDLWNKIELEEKNIYYSTQILNDLISNEKIHQPLPIKDDRATGGKIAYARGSNNEELKMTYDDKAREDRQLEISEVKFKKARRTLIFEGDVLKKAFKKTNIYSKKQSELTFRETAIFLIMVETAAVGPIFPCVEISKNFSF
jgi:hypothetical protein